MKKTIIAVAIIILSILFICCTEGPGDTEITGSGSGTGTETGTGDDTDTGDTGATEEPAYLYFGGRDDRKATVWKVNRDDYSDMEATALTDGTDFMTVVDLKLDGDDLHALVKNGTSPYTMCYYKNTELVKELDDTDLNAVSFVILNDKAYIFADDLSDMYLYIVDDAGSVERYTVASGYYPAATDIIIDGSIVYLSGTYSQTAEPPIYYAFVFTGDLTHLGTGFTSHPVPAADTAASVSSLYLDQSTLYAAGRLSTANYWKISTETMSITGSMGLAETAATSHIQDICLTDGSVYAVSYEYAGSYKQLLYWKDGTAHQLNTPDNHCLIYEVFVSGTDVYSCGYETIDKSTVGTTKVARFWRGTTSHDLTDDTHDAVINCMTADF